MRPQRPAAGKGITWWKNMMGGKKASAVPDRGFLTGLRDEFLYSQMERFKREPLRRDLVLALDRSNHGIRVRIHCGLGNQIFQYCMGRILAEKTGTRMECLLSQSGTRHSTKSIAIKKVFDVDLTVPGQKRYGRQTYVYHQLVDFGKIDPNRPILVDGYFQRYEYYKPYKRQIREWLNVDRLRLPDVDQETLAVHVRLGDYVKRDIPWDMSARYYERAIESAKWKNVTIITDERSHPTVRHLQKKYRAKVVSNDGYEDDFLYLMAHNKIVLSESSFSWWAAWLSDAEEVISSGPRLDFKTYGGAWKDLKFVNLYVDDEKRYRFIN